MTGNTFTVSVDLSKFETELELIQTPEGEMRINLESGLSLLGKPLEWWQTLPTPLLNRLRYQGYSGKTLKVTVNHNGKLKSLETISYQDFLALASYLAKHKNSHAIHLLFYYANIGLSRKLHQIGQSTIL